MPDSFVLDIANRASHPESVIKLLVDTSEYGGASVYTVYE